MVPYQNPTVFFGNIRVDEPITVLTDLLVVGICFFSFIKTRGGNQSTAIKLYRWFILTTGISTLVSAIIGHAFLYHFGFGAKIYGWVTGMASIVFAQFAAIYHSRSILSKATFKSWLIVNAFEIVLAYVLLFVIFSFVIVEVHSAFGLVVTVTILEYAHYKRSQSLLSKYMVIGVGVAVLAVLCHVFKLALSVWFNHLDLSHIIIAIAVYMMHKGIYLENKQEQTIKR